jgi:hypothetical protein
MMGWLAVGGSVSGLGSGGWDAWPLVGIALALWISRRVLRIPWGAPIIITGLVCGLALPPVVNAWGVVPTVGLTWAVTAVALLVRAGRRTNPPRTV